MNHLISIVIPVYNKRETLLGCIESVERNAGIDHELVLVDDGSSDGSREILEALKHRHTVIFQKNAGPSVARNVGAQHAKGNILLFVDADDALADDGLDTHARAFDDPSVEVSIGGNVRVEGDAREPVVPFDWFESVESRSGIRIVQRFSARLIKGIAVDCVAVRKEAFWRAGGFDSSLHCWEISEFLLRLLLGVNSVALSRNITSYQYSSPGNSLFARNNGRSEHASAVAIAMMNLLPRIPQEERQAILSLITSFLYCLVQDGRMMEYKKFARKLGDKTKTDMQLGFRQRLIVSAPDWLLRGIDKYKRSGSFV